MKDVAADMPVRVRALLAVWNSAHARVQKFWYVARNSAARYEDALFKADGDGPETVKSRLNAEEKHLLSITRI